MFDLHDYLELRGYALEQTKLHVIRGKSATPNWAWRATGSAAQDLLDYALRETCCNDASTWRKVGWIPVLLSVDAKGSPYRHLADAYLFLGVLEVLGRQEGLPDAAAGTIASPAWRMRWHRTDGQHLLVNPQMKKAARGWDYWADSKTAKNTTARQFHILGRADTRIAVPTPPRLRGFKLSFEELVDRLDRPNWIEFLDAAGIYLIQVYEPAQQEFYRYVGKAERFHRRWGDYARSGGTGGAGDEGNKFLRALRARMGAAFEDRWSIQILRVCDTDEIHELEGEVKRSLCTYHLEVSGFEGYKARLGLNGN